MIIISDSELAMGNMNQAELAVAKYDDLRAENADISQCNDTFLSEVLNVAEFKNKGYNFEDGSRLEFLRQYFVIGEWK